MSKSGKYSVFAVFVTLAALSFAYLGYIYTLYS